MSFFDGFIGAIRRGDFVDVRRRWRAEFVDARWGGGRSSLHWASQCDTNGNIVRFLLEAGVNIEGVDGSGCRPIHCAVFWGLTITVRVLVDARCSLEAVTERGETPLDIAVRESHHDCVEILRVAMRDDEIVRDSSPWKVEDPRSGETVLDRAMRSPRMMAAMRAKPVSKQEVKGWISSMPGPKDLQSIESVQECLLYWCIRHNNQSGFVTLCSAEIVNRRTLFMGPSALETAVEFDGVLFVAHILKKLFMFDKSWTRAAAMAKKNELNHISLLLSERRSYLKDMEEKGYSRLHIAVYDNDPDMVRYILENKLCDLDEGDKTVGTALSLAYSQGHMSCVRCLQDNNVNVNTVDRLRQSPLHVAITIKGEDCCEYLVENTRDIDAVDYIGLSALALAVMKDCSRICERIIDKMTGVDHRVKIDPRLLDADPDLRMVLGNAPHIRLTSRETTSSLCVKINRTIYPCLLNTIDEQSICLTDEDNNTLLHLCAVSLLPDMCHQLILRSACVTSVNDRGETPLLSLIQGSHNMYIKEGGYDDNNTVVDKGAVGGQANVGGASEFEMDMIKTVDVLIAAGSSVNVETSEGFNLFRIATEFNSEKLLLALIKRREHITEVKKAEWLWWFHKKLFVFIAEVLPLINKSLLSEWITMDLIKCTTTVADLSLVKALYDMAVIDVQTSAVETILYRAAKNCNDNLFEEMSKHEISSKSSLEGGGSLLNCLIKERRTRFCRILLDSRNSALLLEKKDAKNKLPLHVCIESDNWDIIDQLIWETKSVNEEDNDGHTPLSLLFVKMSETEEDGMIGRLMGYVRTLTTRSADIYKMNKFGKAVISYYTKIGLQGQIEGLFLKHRPPKVVSDAPPSKYVVRSEASHLSTAVAGAADNTICQICCDERINCALTCGHMFCMTCADKEVYCFVCRRLITDKRRLFM